MSKPVGSVGKQVYIHQTGEIFPTINLAAKALGISQSVLSNYKRWPIWLQELQIEIIPPDRKERQNSARLKYLFGITLDDYNELFNKQNGVCAICGKPETVKSCYSNNIKKLSIDHNHITGQVRGLLCDRCNRLLGYAKESIQNLQNAITYLKRN